MKRSTLSIIVTLFLSCSKLTSFAQPSFERFTEDEIDYMPSLQGITSQTVVDLQKGSVVLNGRQWVFVKADGPHSLDDVTEHSIDMFTIEDMSYQYSPLPFCLYAGGTWVSAIPLTHKTKRIKERRIEYPLSCTILLKTQLSEREQALPLFQTLAYSKPFKVCQNFEAKSPENLQLMADHQMPIAIRCLRPDFVKERQSRLDQLSMLKIILATGGISQ